MTNGETQGSKGSAGYAVCLTLESNERVCIIPWVGPVDIGVVASGLILWK